MPQCKGCNAEIEWFETIRGKKAPVDATPEKRYVVRERLNQKAEVIGHVVELVNTYMPHHATCPKVEEFRKPKP